MLVRDFLRAGRPARGRLAPGRGAGAGARCSSPARSGSATPGATSPSPTRCASARPDVEVHWLAQDPVTRARGARRAGTPGRRFLAGESAHVESEAGEHDLHAFQAIRRMDEILVANFMVFARRCSRRSLRPVVGDEAWEIDYFLHENPELKRAPFVWLTDFVGWLPMPAAASARPR